MAESILGIPSRSEYGSLDDIKKGDILEYVRQLHKAERAGKHYDFRIGNPDLGMLSWATRKDYPKPGDKPVELFRQPLHSYSYRKWEGRIPFGYGKGDVSIADAGKILVTKKDGKKLSFTTAHESVPKRYSIVPKNGNGLLIRAKDPKHAPAVKPKFKNISTSKIDDYVKNIGPQDIVQPKVDGSLTFFHLLPSKEVEALSWRTSKRTGGPIVHTERFWGERPKLNDLPKEYTGAVLLGEMYGERKGKVVPPQVLGGILNSTIATALNRQKKEHVKLKSMLFDIVSDKTKDMPYKERLEELKKVVKVLPNGDKFSVPDTVKGPIEGQKMLEQIRSGKNPLTREGVVVRKEDGTDAKAKLMDEADVYIRDIFEGTGKFKDKGAGGFQYSLTADGPIVGKCGTGFIDQLRFDMWKHPQDFLGRVARVKYQAQYKKTGAYRVPVLLAIHESK